MFSPMGLLLVLFLFVLAATSGEETLYVDQAFGSQESPTCSSTFPCKNITTALRKVKRDGTTIKVCPGTYLPLGDISNLTHHKFIAIEGVVNASDIPDVSCVNTGAVKIQGFENEIDCQDRISTRDGKSDNVTSLLRAFDIINSSITRLQNLVVTQCDASIVKRTNISILNCEFSYNCGEFGGSIAFFDSDYISIENTQFVNNEGVVRGGAVSLDATSYYFRNCNFIGNKALGLKSVPSLRNNEFVDSNLGGRGGAIFTFGSSSQNLRMVEGSRSKSKADDSGFTGNFVSCNFTGNVAALDGGAVTLLSITDSFTNFINVRFENNTLAPFNTCLGGDCNVRGGAVYSSNAPSKFEKCVFKYNAITTNEIDTSAQGGAIFSTTPNEVNAGHLDATQLLLNDTYFEYNSVNSVEYSTYGGYGGAVVALSQSFLFVNVYFVRNSVGSLNSDRNLFPQFSSSGGALFVSNPPFLSFISNCHFYENYIVGGSGGAANFLSVEEQVNITGTDFVNNTAWSSYTMKSHGGAIMATKNSILNIQECDFLNNIAQPRRNIDPLTNSGEGGAIYSQSSVLNGTKVTFRNNLARTGQFDSGSGGGAIFMEDSYNSSLYECHFSYNGAAGLNRASSYTAAGSGGAMFLKFSFASIGLSTFESNWASAGGLQYSIGGAISCFFEFVNDKSSPIVISDTIFKYNVAFGVVSTSTLPDMRAGQGGAMAILGVTSDGVNLTNVSFVGNVADSDPSEPIFSTGGGLAVSQGSIVQCINCLFSENIAIGGFGNDVATPINSDNKDQLGFVNCTFSALNVSGSLIEVLVHKRILEALVKEITQQETTEFKHNLTETHFYHLSEYYYSQYEDDENLLYALSYDLDKNLNPFNVELMSTLISICCSSGNVLFAGNNTFSTHSTPNIQNGYHIILGNILSFLTEETLSNDLNNASLIIQGVVTEKALMISAINSHILIENKTKLSRLNVVNCSMYFGSDIAVTDETVMYGSNFYPIEDKTEKRRRNSIVEFGGKIFYGTQGFDSNIDTCKVKEVIKARTRLGDLIQHHHLVFSGVDVLLSGTMYYASNNLINETETNVTSQAMRVSIFDAKITIGQNGTMAIRAPTVVDGNGPNCSLQNDGEISISSEEQRFTTLRVEGCNYSQGKSGVLDITLDNDFSTQSVMYIESNSSVSGKINTTFAPYTTLLLYPPDKPSSFDIISFMHAGRSSNSTEKSLEFIAESGVTFKSRDDSNQDKYYRFVTDLVVSTMACEAVETYYYMDPSIYTTSGMKQQYLCHLCLLNSSCHYCNGQCNSGGYDSCGGSSVFTESCCVDNCNGRGTCDANAEYTTYTCTCNFWFSGDTCSVLSLASFLFIAFGVFIFLFGLISFRYYIYYQKQPTQLLEDLLHQLSGDVATKEVVNSDTLQRLQQEFILKDVFVKYEEIKIEEQIGEGSFGVVYKADFRGAQVALKKLRSPMFMQLSATDIEEFRKEAYMMSRLRHPNIVLVMGISVVGIESSVERNDSMTEFDSPEKPLPAKTLCILTEFLEQGSLADLLYGRERVPADIWSYELVLLCAIQAGKGMLYLHSQSPPICHRDLKSSNLVVDNHWVVKVTDFGMSRIVPESSMMSAKVKTFPRQSSKAPEYERTVSNDMEMTSNLGTTAWCAPEIFTSTTKARYSLPVDVYSFGMVLWELWERKRPYEELLSRFDVIDAIKAGKCPVISDSCPTGLRSMIQRCWNFEPARRPRFGHIVRYLKEELARVQRQRAASGSMGRNKFLSDLLSPFSMHSSPSSATADINGDEYGKSKSGDHSKDNSGANWLFSSMNMRSRKYHSNINSPLGENLLTPGAERSNDSNVNDGSSPSSLPNRSKPASSAANIGGVQPSWRDRYVMKFSGWNASTPDKGLAPSLRAPQGGASTSRNLIAGQNSVANNNLGHGGNSVNNIEGYCSFSNHIDEETGKPIPWSDTDRASMYSAADEH